MTTSGGTVTLAINEGIISSVEKSSETVGGAYDLQAVLVVVVLAMVSIGVMGVLAYFSSAKDRVETEINEVEDEREALNAFGNRIDSLPVADEVAVGNGPPLQTFDGGNRPISDVETAFEETLLALPHYRRTYGDDDGSHLVSEFGPDVVESLRHQRSLSPVLHETLRKEVRKAADDRADFLVELRRERNALFETESDVEEVLSDLREMNRQPLGEKNFADLRSDHERLAALEDRLRSISNDRQAQVHRTSRKFHLDAEDPTLQEYLYDDDEFTYPVLATVERVNRLIDRARRTVVRVASQRA